MRETQCLCGRNCLIQARIFDGLFGLGFLGQRRRGEDALDRLFKADAFQSQINGFRHGVLNVAETGGKSSGRFWLYPLAVCGFAFRIKPKRLKRIKIRRPKLAGRIKELAKNDIEAATTLAYRGREFTEIEALLHLYHSTQHEMNQVVQPCVLAPLRLCVKKINGTDKHIVDALANVCLANFADWFGNSILTQRR